MSNVLSKDKRVRIVACLAEGNSVRATSRLVGVAFNTVLKFVPLIGQACANYQRRVLRNLKCERIQCDEIWAFVGCKESHLLPEERKQGRGDCWTWTALDPDSKLIVCWHVGLREAADAMTFTEDLASRLDNRVQLTTDGHSLYLDAVEVAFGENVDYGMAIKVFGRATEDTRIEARYSPGKCKEVRREVVSGSPDRDHISTSHNERQNLSMRMHMRRFTRLTNAFSKKMENHAHAVALYFMFYNFCRIHQTLRCTPAMEAGVTDHVWELSEVVGLIEN